MVGCGVGSYIPEADAFVKVAGNYGSAGTVRCNQVVATRSGEFCLNTYTKRNKKWLIICIRN